MIASEDQEESAMDDSFRVFQTLNQIPLKHTLMNSIDQNEIIDKQIDATRGEV